MSAAHLLVCDDDARLRELAASFLGRHGFRVSAAADAPQARTLCAAIKFDALILDVMLGQEDGLSLLRSLRARPHGRTLPVLMLSALQSVEHRISGLREGADDYLPKPFEPTELLLRLQALLRRTRVSVAAEPIAMLGGVYDVERGTITASDGAVLALTAGENRLFALLARGDTITREAAADVLGGDPRTLDVAVARLRKKLGDCIVTVRGRGYRLKLD